MQQLGNGIAILGIIVTFGAYAKQHTGISLAELEPGLATSWNRLRGWVRRRLGRTQTHELGGVVMATSGTFGAVGIAWRPIQPGDDIAVRVDKLAQNLDELRIDVEGLRSADQHHREIASELAQRITDLDQSVTQRHEDSRRAATTAMRWEFRGMLLTLLGTVLSSFG